MLSELIELLLAVLGHLFGCLQLLVNLADPLAVLDRVEQLLALHLERDLVFVPILGHHVVELFDGQVVDSEPRDARVGLTDRVVAQQFLLLQHEVTVDVAGVVHGDGVGVPRREFLIEDLLLEKGARRRRAGRRVYARSHAYVVGGSHRHQVP